MNHRTLPPGYFEGIYAENIDPWGFETRPYEAAKYAATLAALPRQHYRNGWEIGCSIGVLTQQLAQRCDALLSVDVVDQVLEGAKARCSNLPQVRFQIMRVPNYLPANTFNLIVLSEVGYYLSWADLRRTQQAIMQRLAPGGTLVLVHWTLFARDYPLSGDQVHDSFMHLNELRHLHGERHGEYHGERYDEYRLDVWERQ